MTAKIFDPAGILFPALCDVPVIVGPLTLEKERTEAGTARVVVLTTMEESGGTWYLVETFVYRRKAEIAYAERMLEMARATDLEVTRTLPYAPVSVVLLTL